MYARIRKPLDNKIFRSKYNSIQYTKNIQKDIINELIDNNKYDEIFELLQKKT